MICQPKEVFTGASLGTKTWLNIVFPSLLPFFIASELLMSFGLVGFLGVLTEPLMRPLFNVPGSGSFVLCIGYTSGYPIGAMVTARLRSQKLCTRVEAERLMSFTNNSSPLFMIVAISVGMFNRPELAAVIAGAHYLSNLTLGLVLRFYRLNDTEVLPAQGMPSPGGIFARAAKELYRHWDKEDRPLGRIIGDAVSNAIQNLLKIGGFIILFAVLIRLFNSAGIIDRLASLLGVILLPLGFSHELLPSLASGFFEMTIGSKIASESPASLIQQVMAAGMILAWSGLSVHAQVAAMISGTDIRMTPFVISRAAHAALAALYTIILFKPLTLVFTGRAVPAAAMGKIQAVPALLFGLQLSGGLLAVSILLLVSLSIIYISAKKIKLI